MTFAGEKIDVRLMPVWSDQTGMDDSWLDNMWPESDVLGQIARERADDQPAANEFREVLNGDNNPKWVEVWAHIYLGKVFDITGQRDRAVNEYTQAQRTRDNTQGAQEEVGKYLQKPYSEKSEDAV